MANQHEKFGTTGLLSGGDELNDLHATLNKSTDLDVTITLNHV